MSEIPLYLAADSADNIYAGQNGKTESDTVNSARGEYSVCEVFGSRFEKGV